MVSIDILLFSGTVTVMIQSGMLNNFLVMLREQDLSRNKRITVLIRDKNLKQQIITTRHAMVFVICLQTYIYLFFNYFFCNVKIYSV